jgi:glycosyltransferase involved in cell wall biosynthesis
MIKKGKPKVIVVMPAYNAERTLKKTYYDIPKDYVDEIILVDDASKDRTAEIAGELGLEVIVHSKNKGYGGNQKTCYTNALNKNAGIIVMVHPDYQYDPSVLPHLIKPILEGERDIMLGSRMVYKKNALKGRMPLYKFISNIFLTKLENIVFGLSLSEYHTGLRAYNARVLQSINFLAFEDGFVFDTEMIANAVKFGFRIGEVPIRTRYEDDSSTISLRQCIEYALKTFRVLYNYKRYDRT